MMAVRVGASQAAQRYALARIRGKWTIVRIWPTAFPSCWVWAAGCSQKPPEGAADAARQRPSAEHATSPLTTARHLAGIEAAGLTGDQRAMRAHVDAMHQNMMHDTHLADPAQIGRASCRERV